MFAGIAGALLVFTGIWHATEFLMGGRNKDTVRLIPVGLIYVVLGVLIVTMTGGWVTQIIALIATIAGLLAAFITRASSEVRPWVTWAFIVLDVVIVACLGAALL